MGSGDRNGQTMQDPLWCAPGVHLARVHEDIVILDLATDQYNCLLDAAAVIEVGADGALHVSGDGVSSDLMDAGVATAQPDPRMRQAPLPARRDLPLDAEASTLEIVSAGLDLAVATMKFRGRSLAELVAARPRVGASTSVLDPDGLSRWVGAARKARPWIPFEGECLQRSFQLRHVLARRGIRADWVFGVRTWPFAAHCWLQIDDLVVGDRLERVSLYTPILKA